MKPHILFVDDEREILEGLGNRLRRLRKLWRMSFVDSGVKALALMDSEAVDVIVTDMRMAEMDGVALLERIQQRHPQAARIVLSGHADVETALRAVPVTHQYLNKPCEAGVLEGVIRRAVELKALIDDAVVRRTVGRIQTLPSPPAVYARLMSVLEDETASAEDVAQVLRRDVAMCAKLLQIANSAFFRLARPVASVEQAVAHLGFDAVKRMALAIEVFQRDGAQARSCGLSLEGLQRHSLQVAEVCAGMFDDPRRREDAFTAGLLHDVGKLLLAAGLPEYIVNIREALAGDPRPAHEVERELFGVTHAEIGAYLLSLWGVPHVIVEAVADHHAPLRVPLAEFDILAAVHVADLLVEEPEPPVLDDVRPARPEPDPAYLEELGVAERLEGWRDLSRRRAEAVMAFPA